MTLIIPFDLRIYLYVMPLGAVKSSIFLNFFSVSLSLPGSSGMLTKARYRNWVQLACHFGSHDIKAKTQGHRRPNSSSKFHPLKILGVDISTRSWAFIRFSNILICTIPKKYVVSKNKYRWNLTLSEQPL